MPWHPLDHLLIVVLMVVLPIRGLYTFRRLVAAVRAGRPNAKTRAYRNTMLLQWSLVAALVAGWHLAARPWAAVGLAAGSSAGAIAGVAFVAAGLGLVAAQQRGIAKLSPDALERLRSGMGDVAQLLPSTPIELRWFSATALTAGICEELLYRGFVLWYLSPAFGSAGAVLVGSLAFGCGHAYQGRQGIIKTSVVGLVLGSVYLLSGTLWAPMLLHAAMDLSAAAIGRRLASAAAGTAA